MMPKATTQTPAHIQFERYARAALAAGLSLAQFQIFAHAGIVLQPKQLEFAAACFECDKPDGPTAVGFGGARGGGKSHAGLAILAVDCLRYDGLTCLLLRKVGKANRENFNELRLKVLRGVKTTYKIQENVLIFPNGSRIVLGHFQKESDIDAYLGLEYDVILVEEATTLTASKYKAITTCNRTSKPGWRPRMYSTTNPGGVGHAWYKKLFIAPWKALQRNRHHLLPLGVGVAKATERIEQAAGVVAKPETLFIPSTVDDNKCVNREYIKILDDLVGWQKRAWRYGDWDIAAGQYFTNFRTDLHIVPHEKLLLGGEYAKSGSVGCSLDYGFSHYTTVYLLAKNGDGEKFILDEHAERRWLPKRHAPAIHAMLERHDLMVGDLDFFVAGNDTFAPRANETGKSVSDDYADEGIYLTRANDDRIGRATEFLQSFGDLDATDKDGNPTPIVPTLYISDLCGRLIESLPSLEHDPHNPEKVLKVDTDDEGEGGDDFYDGAGYGLMEFAKKPTNDGYNPSDFILAGNRSR